MLCRRRPIADAEPVRGSLIRDLDQTLVLLHLAPARETRPCLVGYSAEEDLYNTGVHGMMASAGSALVALHNWGCSWGVNPPVSRRQRAM